MNRPAIATGVLCLALAGASFAVASHDPNSIHACVNKKTRAVRIVNRAGGCRADERATKWNVKGPPGQPGSPGPEGSPGPPGESIVGQACTIPNEGGDGVVEMTVQSDGTIAWRCVVDDVPDPVDDVPDPPAQYVPPTWDPAATDCSAYSAEWWPSGVFLTSDSVCVSNGAPSVLEEDSRYPQTYTTGLSADLCSEYDQNAVPDYMRPFFPISGTGPRGWDLFCLDAEGPPVESFIEWCNGLDDDMDGLGDEGFLKLGERFHDDQGYTWEYICSPSGDGYQVGYVGKFNYG